MELQGLLTKDNPRAKVGVGVGVGAGAGADVHVVPVVEVLAVGLKKNGETNVEKWDTGINQMCIGLQDG